MEKVIRCRDVGYDCDGVIRARNEEDAMRMAAEHAKSVHGLQQVSPQIESKLRLAMHDEPDRGMNITHG